MSEAEPGATAASARFANVAVVSSALSGRSTELTYQVPVEHLESVEVGSIVWAPIRERLTIGVVTGVTDSDPGFVTRPLAGVESHARLSESQLAVARWIAHETVTSIGAAASLFFPPGIEGRAIERIRVASDQPDAAQLTSQQAQTLRALGELGETTPDDLRKQLNRPLTTILPALIASGFISRRIDTATPPSRPTGRRQLRITGAAPKRALTDRQQVLLKDLSLRQRAGSGDGWIEERSLLDATSATRETTQQLVRQGLIETRMQELPGPDVTRDLAPVLTSEQRGAWTAIERLLDARDAKPLLLRGVTGSGKTEIYLRAIAWCLRHGRSAIVLAPEIALASQLVRRVAARFPDDTAILHSGLRPAERLKTWRAIADGNRSIVVGPRSALFAPLEDIGLIVLDEEHEPAYKQDNDPRYHARSVAECLAQEHGAVVILGSATPSIESVMRARSGEIHEVRLPSRVSPLAASGSDESLELPKVDVVDLRLELHRGNPSLLSETLTEAVNATISNGDQALLFLNRRGSATVVLCGDCGHTLRCPYCDIPHVYHEDRKRLICHRCGFQAFPPVRCPECSGHLQFLGAGTQRVAQVASLTFPKARVARWDQDSVRKRGAQERLLHQIENREFDIIVGTQMIAKGLDLPRVTTVGVVQADSLLQLPDFRSAERAFQLITQVAGRAGRRRAGGRVIVQTFDPAHYAIQAAAHHDVDAFLIEELEFRRRHRYPPFSRLIRYVVRRSTDEQCAEEADGLVRAVARHARRTGVEIDLLGPIPAFAYRIAGQYQWQLIVRAAPDDLDALLNELPAPAGWVVDVDPQNVL